MFINIYVFILGSVIASFIHLYVTRLLKGESIITPHSHCPSCHHMLKWYELIPILSYILQKGRCLKCGSKIGLDSLLWEILLGSLYLIVYIRYGLSYETLLGFTLVSLLMSVCLSDFKEMIILDSTFITVLILVYIITYLNLGLRGIYKSFMYGVFAFVLFYLIKIIGDQVFKKESLGGGDIKLALIMGSVLPYNLFLTSLIIGSSLALPYAVYTSIKKSDNRLPYGPFLTMGLFIVFLFKNDIIEVLNIIIE